MFSISEHGYVCGLTHTCHLWLSEVQLLPGERTRNSFHEKLESLIEPTSF